MVKMMLSARKDGAFTLIEVIIAIAILGFSLLAILPLLFTSLSINTETALASRAQMLAAERVNQLQTWPESQILNSSCLTKKGGADKGVCVDGNNGEVDTFNGIKIYRTYRFDELNVQGSKAPSYIITVTVSYNYKGQQVSRVFTATWIRP